jgi:hypothetical protein
MLTAGQNFVKIRNSLIETDKPNLIDLVFINTYPVDSVCGGYHQIYHIGDIAKGVDLGKGDYRVIGEKHITVFHKSAPKVMPLAEWNNLSDSEQKRIMVFVWNYRTIKNKLNEYFQIRNT